MTRASADMSSPRPLPLRSRPPRPFPPSPGRTAPNAAAGSPMTKPIWRTAATTPAHPATSPTNTPCATSAATATSATAPTAMTRASADMSSPRPKLRMRCFPQPPETSAPDRCPGWPSPDLLSCCPGEGIPDDMIPGLLLPAGGLFLHKQGANPCTGVRSLSLSG